VAGILLTYAAVLYAVFGLSVWARIRRNALHPVVAGVALVATAVGTVTEITCAERTASATAPGSPAPLAGAALTGG
jgi:hypothetical protein